MTFTYIKLETPKKLEFRLDLDFLLKENFIMTFFVSFIHLPNKWTSLKFSKIHTAGVTL